MAHDHGRWFLKLVGYDPDAVERALAQSDPESGQLWMTAQVEVRKVEEAGAQEGQRYQALVLVNHHPVATVWGRSAAELQPKLQAEFDKLHPEPFVRTQTVEEEAPDAGGR